MDHKTKSRRRSPQEKKKLSTKRDCVNVYGEDAPAGQEAE